MIPDHIKKFIDLFSELPSIGPRQATRLAFYLINQGKATLAEYADAIAGLAVIDTCPNCFHMMKRHVKNLCDICGNPARREDVIAIVEKETDLMSLEKTRKFNGRYLVIGDMSKDGMLTSLQKLRLNHLKTNIKKLKEGQAEEILLALNPGTYGDLDSALIVQELKPFAKKITRLGRGLPTGGEIEFADEETLGGALEHRS